MSLPRSISKTTSVCVPCEVEGIDRMYLSVFVPRLQSEKGVAAFFVHHRGAKVASSSLMQPITKRFIADIESFAQRIDVPLVRFDKSQRKDDVAKPYLTDFREQDDVMFIGMAQEKALVVRTLGRHNPETGKRYAALIRSMAMVDHYYFYCVDRDFGTFFLKFCSYFPYTGKLCINGQEYLRCQLDKHGVAYELLDNKLLSCEDPEHAQRICDDLSGYKIEQLFRKWLLRLPNPFSFEDRMAGYTYELSILQADFFLSPSHRRQRAVRECASFFDPACRLLSVQPGRAA